MDRQTLATAGDGADRAIIFVGGVAALLAGLVFRRNLSAEYAMLKTFGLFAGGPEAAPADALGWFDLARRAPGYAFTLLDGFDLVNYLLVGLMYGGAHRALRKSAATLAAAGLAAVGVGVAVYFSTNQIFPVLTLAARYASADDPAVRAGFLTAGEALLAAHAASVTYAAGWNPPFLFVTFGGLLFALAARRSGLFGKAAPVVGITATLFGLGFYLTAPLAPEWNALPIAGSAPFLMAWYLLVGVKLVALAKRP